MNKEYKSYNAEMRVLDQDVPVSLQTELLEKLIMLDIPKLLRKSDKRNETFYSSTGSSYSFSIKGTPIKQADKGVLITFKIKDKKNKILYLFSVIISRSGCTYGDDIKGYSSERFLFFQDLLTVYIKHLNEE